MRVKCECWQDTVIGFCNTLNVTSKLKCGGNLYRRYLPMYTFIIGSKTSLFALHQLHINISSVFTNQANKIFTYKKGIIRQQFEKWKKSIVNRTVFARKCYLRCPNSNKKIIIWKNLSYFTHIEFSFVFEYKCKHNNYTMWLT